LTNNDCYLPKATGFRRAEQAEGMGHPAGNQGKKRFYANMAKSSQKQRKEQR